MVTKLKLEGHFLGLSSFSRGLSNFYLKVVALHFYNNEKLDQSCIKLHYSLSLSTENITEKKKELNFTSREHNGCVARIIQLFNTDNST